MDLRWTADKNSSDIHLLHIISINASEVHLLIFFF